jgi:hypothetical protein
MTEKPELPEPFLRKLESVTNKRAKVVIDHILEHGFITTEELEKQYGYNHPPRAARDVREQGIPLETFRLLCAACNRAKSWSCEHCPNWKTKAPVICKQCYWAFPHEYTHIALREIRRTDIIWDEGEMEIYNELKEAAKKASSLIPDHVKRIVTQYLTSEEGRG